MSALPAGDVPVRDRRQEPDAPLDTLTGPMRACLLELVHGPLYREQDAEDRAADGRTWRRPGGPVFAAETVAALEGLGLVRQWCAFGTAIPTRWISWTAEGAWAIRTLRRNHV